MGFLIFDKILNKNRPTREELGNKSFDIWCSGRPWGIVDGNKIMLSDMTSEQSKEFAKTLPNQLICLDIENLNWGTDAIIEKNSDNLIMILDSIRSVRPELRLGFYGILPPVAWNPPGQKWTWKQVASRLLYGRGKNGRYQSRGLADCVDYISPTSYLTGPMVHWLSRQKQSLREARDYQKQIYPFVSYAFAGNRDLLEINIWKEQLHLMKEMADGVIIWTSPNVQWSEEHWQIAIEILKESDEKFI